MMTPTEARRQVASILHEIAVGDYEKAHAKLDDLNVEVLRTIANRDWPSNRTLAQIAVEANALEFPRYCA